MGQAVQDLTEASGGNSQGVDAQWINDVTNILSSGASASTMQQELLALGTPPCPWAG